ncbi:Inherit from opiNOG: EGF domain-specific O-linked N-acetylglucosamine (GlcNAc) transferase [Seminavis robusta]|uniref:Inherit from opiNOG: EGF domain-specific O-linked N-acetylglucosamine (GlcNAc) transferase n=1 Tax=Seminavis robusta TaxID=568900 RepID=A0A9N8EY16_9STRA|nr:Inherit from opiNOG: EGF domain-specific O-linked N-acetylglucosamine (GlcNAc) transferase [Seminavis robusta]|eukprot:Sro2059_g312900.1 Inherit from opiNOG: EGF domain-specific O-linked N-acetylglucosamine (GlcNAc) transferase (489) ;mRNA; r:5879-7345
MPSTTKQVLQMLSKHSLYIMLVLGSFISLLHLPFSNDRILPEWNDESMLPTLRGGDNRTKRFKATTWEPPHPFNLTHCMSLRIKGVEETLNFEDNVHLLKPFAENGRNVRVGVSLYEDSNDFWSLNGNGYVHLYHYLEFILYAYTAMDQVANTVAPPAAGHETSLSESPVQVAWVHAPHFTRKELKGDKDTNQMIADLAFWQSSILGTTKLKGLEDNDDKTRAMHPQYTGKMPDGVLEWVREKKRQYQIPRNSKRRNNWSTMAEEADAVIFVNRHRCDHMALGVMHAKLSNPGYFPSEAWSKDIAQGLKDTTSSLEQKEKDKNKFVACYIDRQNNARRMPDEEHEWLVQTLTDHPDVSFRHLHMERYPALEQFRISHTCNMMIGVHGNGLSHMLWMPKGSWVVEYWWDTDFVWCYGVLALLMNHDFRAFWRGKPILQQRILDRDVSLQSELNEKLRHSKIDTELSRREFNEFLNNALAKFAKDQESKQ